MAKEINLFSNDNISTVISKDRILQRLLHMKPYLVQISFGDTHIAMYFPKNPFTIFNYNGGKSDYKDSFMLIRKAKNPA